MLYGANIANPCRLFPDAVGSAERIHYATTHMVRGGVDTARKQWKKEKDICLYNSRLTSRAVLVQLQDKIVARFVHTTYPYSFGDYCY